MYKYTDYLEQYDRIMQFNKNKEVSVHRWYPFVEGYSKEFINSVVDEQGYDVKLCLEPFSGSGTTALELSRRSVSCISFEVNPFMFVLSKAKLKVNQYKIRTIRNHVSVMTDFLANLDDSEIDLKSEFPTLVESQDKKKWNLDKEVFIALEKLKLAIDSLNTKL
ncbi:TPA: DNA adenine methylase, partial [Streptococcus suis]|nr:DNA adenine methylase [Streptococcus suis]